MGSQIDETVFFALHEFSVTEGEFFALQDIPVGPKNRQLLRSSSISRFRGIFVASAPYSVTLSYIYFIHLFPTLYICFREPIDCFFDSRFPREILARHSLQPRVLCTDSRKDSEKIILRCFPARNHKPNPTATADDSQQQLTISDEAVEHTP